MAMTASAPAFDTLPHARRLKAAVGADAHAEAGAAIGNAGDRATTKADLAALRAGFSRALWIQGGAIAALAGLIAGAGQ